MSFKAIIERTKRKHPVSQILRQQLLWMLLLRVFLYTSLSILGYLLQGQDQRFLPMPTELLISLLLVIYSISIVSALRLLSPNRNLLRFGFIQTLLDTLFATFLIYYTGISSSIFSSIYFFPIIAGGLILPRKGGLFAAASSTLLYGFILFLEINGYYPKFLLQQGFIAENNPFVCLNTFSVKGLTFFLAAVLSALFSLRTQRTEAALHSSLKNYDQLEILYKQIFDNIATGIITVNQDDTITSANNATTEITGYTSNSLVGRDLKETFSSLNLSAPRMRQSTDFTRKDGQPIRLGYSHVNLKQNWENESNPRDGLIQQKIITLRDISEIEQLERQMRQAEKLAAIGMMSASIAHDFRNPLTAISGSAQVLADEFSQQKSENLYHYELADIILRESNRMIDTIADFLKFSRPETANREWFSLRSCLDEVMQVCKADPAWPLSTTINITFDETVDVWADPKQINTILNHLIQNGLAFCPPGKEVIDIEAHEIKTNGTGEVLQITVSDNGKGVPEENRKRIFEPFFTSRADGTGLGLAIILQIVEEHQGTITVDSSKTGGAAFTVTLPLPSS